MAFDLASAQPIQPSSGGFDLSTAKPFELNRQNVQAEPERTVGGFVKNIGKSGANMVKGIVSAVAHPIDTLGTTLDIGAGALQNVLPQPLVDFINKSETPEALAAGKRAVEIANAVGGQYKKDYGTLEGFKSKLYNDPVGVAADISTLFSGGSTVATKLGAVDTAAKLGKVASVTNPMNAIGVAGTQLGKTSVGQAIANAPGKLTNLTINTLADIANPKAAALLAATEGKAPEIVNALTNPQKTFTSGYQPTASELITDLNLTKLPAAQIQWANKGEKAGAETARTLYHQRGLAQDQALLNQLAVEPTTVPMLQAQRTGVTAPMYEKALAPAPANFFPETSAIKSTAETKLMGIDNTISKLIKDSPANPDLVTQLQAVQKGMRDAKGNLYTEPKQISSISEGISKALETVKDKHVRSELTSLKEAIYGAIPEYAAAQKKFAELSKPINQAEVASFLKSQLENSATGGLTEAKFIKSVENAPGTVKSATGLTKIEDLNKVLEPEQIKILDQIKSDLVNREKTIAQAKAGGATGALEGAQMPKTPSIFNKTVSLAGDILNRLQGKIDRKIAMELAVDMLDPNKAAMSISKAWQYGQTKDYYTKLIKEGAREAIKATASQPAVAAGQITNALATNKQPNQNALAR
jgi:hypothetical protein